MIGNERFYFSNLQKIAKFSFFVMFFRVGCAITDRMIFVQMIFLRVVLCISSHI